MRGGSVTLLTVLKGLDVTKRSPSAHAKTVRAAVSHTSLTVRAPRSAVTSCRDQFLASSSVMSLVLSKRCSRSRNTTRHLLIVEEARRVSFTHASNSCHGLVLP